MSYYLLIKQQFSFKYKIYQKSYNPKLLMMVTWFWKYRSNNLNNFEAFFQYDQLQFQSSLQKKKTLVLGLSWCMSLFVNIYSVSFINYSCHLCHYMYTHICEILIWMCISYHIKCFKQKTILKQKTCSFSRYKKIKY